MWGNGWFFPLPPFWGFPLASLSSLSFFLILTGSSVTLEYPSLLSDQIIAEHITTRAHGPFMGCSVRYEMDEGKELPQWIPPQ